MTTGSLESSHSWKRAAPAAVKTVKSAAASIQTPEYLVDLEFSEVGRSARMPAGWFVLPSAGFGLFLLCAFLHAL